MQGFCHLLDAIIHTDGSRDSKSRDDNMLRISKINSVMLITKHVW